MQIGRIEGATRVLGKSQGYMGLPLRDIAIECTVNGPSTPAMETAWLPTPAEIAAIDAGAPVILRILGTGHPPVMVYAGQPSDVERPVVGWALINAAGHIIIWNTAKDVVEQVRERRYPDLPVTPLYTHPAAMAALYAIQAEGPSSEADRREA